MITGNRRAVRDPVVLIVEDEHQMRTVLREFLCGAFPEIAVHEAQDGAGALSQCAGLRPDLVLMDMRLPDADGLELTARIRALYPGTRVIVTSYASGLTYFDRAHAAGALAFIVKDRLAIELIDAVARSIGIEPGRRQRRGR